MSTLSVLSREEKMEADKTIRDMICELIEVMYDPVEISQVKMTSEVGCQAGHSCPECDAYFCNTSGLNKHYRAVHLSYNYVCHYCDSSFDRLWNLQRHAIRAHSNVLKK